jgi:hypothetical protein
VLGPVAIKALPCEIDWPDSAGEDGSLAFPATGGTAQPAVLTGRISDSGGAGPSNGVLVELRKVVITLDDTAR